jgi:hypothetical protein
MNAFIPSRSDVDVLAVVAKAMSAAAKSTIA